jgi:hypothetical protein
MLCELDMGFGVDEVAAGVAELLRREGLAVSAVSEDGKLVFDGPAVRIEVGPLPPDRVQRTALFFPRSLVVLAGEETPLRSFERKLLHHFLRVGG